MALNIILLSGGSGKRLWPLSNEVRSKQFIKLFQNENGEYDTDFIDCTLWNGVAESTAEYCNKGDLIGVKGRLESKEREIEGKKIKVTNLIAEKVTFLTSKQKETEKSNEMEV